MDVTTANEAVAISYPAGVVSNLESGAALPAFLVGAGTPTAVYSTKGGAMHASTIPAGPPATLVTSGAKMTYTLPSPDGKWGVYGTATGSIAGQATADVNLFATSLPAKTTVVDSNADAVMGASFFTADSSRLLWYNGLVAYGGFGVYGTLRSYDIAGATSTVVANKVWNYSTLTGTKVVYNDNTTTVSYPGGASEVTGDIKLVDVGASPLAPKTLQLGATINFLLTPDLKTVVYTYNQGTAAQNGIYAIAAQ